MPTNIFDEARKRVSSGTSVSSSQNDNIFSQARSRVNTGQTVDTIPAKTQRSADSPVSTRKTNLERMDLGRNEGKIGEGWQNRVNTEALVGPSYKDTTAYYDRLLEQKKQQFEAVKPDSNFLSERQRLRYEIDALEQEREAIAASGKRGSFRKEGAGGFGSNSELRINPRSPMQTVSDTIARGAGQFDLGLLKTADFAANALPRAAGAIRGVDPEETFTGQLFKPITDATGHVVDWMQRGVDNMNRDIQNDTKDSKAAQIAAELGSGVVGAAPNAALAMMTGGASAGGAIGSQLAPQATGLSGTILSAWNKMVSSPMFQVSFSQTLGTSYDEAKQAGASDVGAMAAALLSTTANAMVEAGGGIETLPGELSGADLSSGKKALKWLTSALDEGKEEVVQGVISNMVNKAAGTDNRPYFSMTDENAVLNPYRMGQEFAMGAAIGGIMGGGQVLADAVMSRSKAKKSALDFAIEETLKPTQEQANLDRALEGLFEQKDGSENSEEGILVYRGYNRSTDGTDRNLSYNRSLNDVLGKKVHNEVDLLPFVYYTDDYQDAENYANMDFNYLEELKKKYGEEKGVESYRILTGKNTANKGTISEHRINPKKILDLTSLGEETTVDDLYNLLSKEIGIPAVSLDGNDIDGRLMFADIGGIDDDIFPTFKSLRNIPASNGDFGTRFFNFMQEFGYDAVKYREGGANHYAVVQNNDTGSNGQTGPDVNGKSGQSVLDSVRRKWDAYMSETGGLPTMNTYREFVSTLSDAERSALDGWAGDGKNSDTRSNGQPGPVVNGNTDQSDVGDLGAKTSDFRHEVKESKSKTTPAYYEQNNVPEEGRSDSRYTVVHEDESLHNARLRLDQDYDGEIAEMRTKTTWSNEEVDMGQMVLDDLRAEAEKTGDWSKFREWNKVVSEHKSEIGRSMQALVKIKRDTGSDIISNAAKMLENAKKGTDINDVMQTVSDYSRRFGGAVKSKSVGDLVSIIKDTAVTRKTKRHWGKKLGGQIDWALNRIAAYAESEVSQTGNNGSAETMRFYEFLKNFAAASIENVAADQQKVSAGKMAMTIRRNGMLSKCSTIMRNLVGNGVFDIADSVSRDISVPLDMLLSNFTKTRSVDMDYSYLSKAKRKGMMDGLAMAMLETSLDVNARERNSKYESGSQRTFKMSGNFVSKLLSSWESAMGYGLYVTDEMAKGATSAEIQRGLDRLYEKNKIRDDSLRSGGEQEALYRTFQDKTLLSDISIGARNLLNKAHVGDVGFGDVALPFAQVPANLADRAIDYSPVGLAKTAVRLVDVLAKAKDGTLTAAEQAKAVQTLGRNITGSVLIAIATGLAAKGVIRVVNPFGEDENKDQAAFEKMQGQYGTQLNLSAAQRVLNGGNGEWQNGDTLMSIAFLEPFNAHLTIGAMLAEDMESEGQITPKSIKDDTINGIWLSVLDLPMFEKFRDAYDAYQYSNKKRPGDKAIDTLNTLAANEVGSLIPNFAKGIAQGLDPYQRDLYSKEGAWAQAADQFRSVFDRDGLPIKQDSFGRDMRNEGGALNFLNANILPGQITRYKTDDLTDKITDLADTTGKPSVYPSRKAPDKITVDGEDFELTKEQQRKYQSTYGKTEYDTRNALIHNDLYGNLTPQEELKAHGYVETFAKQTAAAQASSEYDTEDWVAELKGKPPEEIADAIMLKTFQSLAEDKKKYDSKYDGITSMLESGNIDEAMAVSMLPKEAEDGYFNQIKGSGIEISTFIDVYQFKTDARSDYDKDGKKVKSAQEKVIEYINRIEKSPEKKRRLFLSMGYAESKIPEEWK